VVEEGGCGGAVVTQELYISGRRCLGEADRLVVMCDMSESYTTIREGNQVLRRLCEQLCEHAEILYLCTFSYSAGTTR
jgi:hypothetical protein